MLVSGALQFGENLLPQRDRDTGCSLMDDENEDTLRDGSGVPDVRSSS